MANYSYKTKVHETTQYGEIENQCDPLHVCTMLEHGRTNLT